MPSTLVNTTAAMYGTHLSILSQEQVGRCQVAMNQIPTRQTIVR
jgi:hypothetical protein